MSQLMNDSISIVELISDLYRVIAPWSIVLQSFNALKRFVEDIRLKVVIGLY
jgi:hypothetical protein